MDWVQFAIFFVGIVGLWLWNRAESRADNRAVNQRIDNSNNRIENILEAMHKEMKDFHGRLCAIEERNRK